MRRLAVPAAVVAAAACLATAAVPSGAGAAAAGLPTGGYTCRHQDGSGMPGITITAGKHYRHHGKTGRYTLSGRTLRFTTGPLKGDFKHGTYTGGISFRLFHGKAYGRSGKDVTCVQDMQPG
jgi:hypothetical protein